MLFESSPWRYRSGRAVALVRFAAAVGIAAALGLSAVAAEEPKAETSEKTAEELGKLRQLFETKNYTEALRIVDAVMARVERKSYDYAIANQAKAQIFMNTGEYGKAIPSLETTLNSGFFEGKSGLDMRFLLVQLYLVEASALKDTSAQKPFLEKATEHVRFWLDKAPPPPETEPGRYTDAIIFYANCLFYQEKFKEAVEVAKRALRQSIHPKEAVWKLMVSNQLNMGDYAGASETLELLVKLFPDSKEYWGNLTQTYIQQASATKDDVSRKFSMRAILSYLRAQEHGALNSPKDYQNLFSLYYNLEEFGRAAEVLETGLRSGKIENTEETWERLSSCFQSLHRFDKVAPILDEGRARFKTGNLDFALAQFLWYEGKYEDGIKAAEMAWRKGGLTKPGKVTGFLLAAYFEQNDLKKAKEMLKKAKEYPENKDVVDRYGPRLLSGELPPPEPPAAAPAVGNRL